MTIDELRAIIRTYELKLSADEVATIEKYLLAYKGVFPFNEWECRLAHLLAADQISISEYQELRTKYVSENIYLELFGLAPRIFGEIWGQEHIRSLDSRFTVPNRHDDTSFDGEYDLVLGRVKIEVKAARAINTKKRGDLVSKALKIASTDPFWMNFQQLKPDLCDVFIFIGVWVDKIIYWVMTPDEVRSSPYISKQHRGGIEYQIGIKNTNRWAFTVYEVPGEKLVKCIQKKTSP